MVIIEIIRLPFFEMELSKELNKWVHSKDILSLFIGEELSLYKIVAAANGFSSSDL